MHLGYKSNDWIIKKFKEVGKKIWDLSRMFSNILNMEHVLYVLWEKCLFQLRLKFEVLFFLLIS